MRHDVRARASRVHQGIDMRIGNRKLRILVCVLGMLVWSGSFAAQYGNTTAASGRPILADGTTYTDQMTPTSTVSWFVFRVDPNQSYSIEVWSPYGTLNSSGNGVAFITLFESDGTTVIPVSSRPFDFPAPQVDSGFQQGDRLTFINSGGARRVALHVQKNGSPPAVAVDFALRIVPTTLAAARWSVNGYNDYFALSNVASTDGFSSINGSILYFSEAGALVGSDPFTLAHDGSVQIVHLSGAAIGGAIRGGVRIVHNGAPGAILAHQTLFSPGTGQFIQYPFQMLVHSYGRGGI
jgi:hypothetical protein